MIVNWNTFLNEVEENRNRNRNMWALKIAYYEDEVDFIMEFITLEGRTLICDFSKDAIFHFAKDRGFDLLESVKDFKLRYLRDNQSIRLLEKPKVK